MIHFKLCSRNLEIDLFVKDINRVVKYIYNILPMVMVVLIAIIGVVNSVVLHHLYCIHFLR